MRNRKHRTDEAATGHRSASSLAAFASAVVAGGAVIFGGVTVCNRLLLWADGWKAVALALVFVAGIATAALVGIAVLQIALRAGKRTRRIASDNIKQKQPGTAKEGTPR